MNEEYNKLNCMLQKIVYLSYNESLKYGYDELWLLFYGIMLVKSLIKLMISD